MSKLAWFGLAAALMATGLLLAAFAGANTVGAGIAVLGLFCLAPADISGFGAGGGDSGDAGGN
jgi:hypothetical protein